MQIVFLNTFEKQTPEFGIASAQLSICERHGVWEVLWVEGEEGTPVTWFEGTSWEEMIAAFRHGAAVKMGEGYNPIIDGMLDERRTLSGSYQTMMQCYGELNRNDELFEALREWRRLRAMSEKRSAYLVATNRMLWMISAFIPHKAEELLQIPGWGETKQAAYAAELLAITCTYERGTSFPLDWVSNALDPKEYTQWLYRQKETKFKGQMDRLQEKRKILTSIQAGESLDQLMQEISLPRRELLDRIEQLDSEGYDLEPLITRELSDMPEAEQQLVWDTMQSVGDRYLKPVLQQVYGEEAGDSRSMDTLYGRLRLLRLRFRRSTKQEAVS
ncbi:HRDC domain-containing protein [Paenibacillus sp. GCM10023252]|uniref:HRDC domain-containing protein n=1 Tax=Paenibacillus sp. GCM10023252 TaxID=3252649 RepID=UPI0036119E27